MDAREDGRSKSGDMEYKIPLSRIFAEKGIREIGRCPEGAV